MLDVIRWGQRWFTAFFVLAVGAVFVFYLGGGGGTGPGTSAAPIRVGPLEVDAAEYFRTRDRQEEMLRKSMGAQFDRRNIIGRSPAMVRLLETVAQVASSEATVLITGESGRGKEMIAGCCSCALILGAGVVGYQAYRGPCGLSTFMPPVLNTVTPAPTPKLDRPSTNSVTNTTLETLENTDVPENDPNELACRLQGVCNVAETIPAKTYQVGDREKFWISNSDTAEHRQGDFTLRYITPHSYFWAEDGTDVNEDKMKRLMDTFENEIYPTDREFFGSEATPGIDNDPHIYVLYAHDIGSNVAGYYNSSGWLNSSMDGKHFPGPLNHIKARF